MKILGIGNAIVDVLCKVVDTDIVSPAVNFVSVLFVPEFSYFTNPIELDDKRRKYKSIIYS